jgi:4-hydroxythreonine-4-phosphate dehydrogenase
MQVSIAGSAGAGRDAPVAVTLGDPAGIGPDIVILSWLLRHAQGCPPFFAAGDAAFYAQRAASFSAGPEFKAETIRSPGETHAVFASALPVLPLETPLRSVQAGKPDYAHAAAITASIEQAVALTLAGSASAVVTAPIAKHVLLAQGFSHPGHTEFLGELARRQGFSDCFPVMLMASERLKAVPVTVHIPLRDVPRALTKERLIRTAEVTDAGLKRYFGIEKPKLAICGLNPHAGEEGEIGREEIELIEPAVAELHARGILASGPAPADTLFHEAARQGYDAVLAMYHDQALIPFKTLSFEDGVNVTLGLPFIRTSPDHGTAFSLAGTGRANPASFIEALRLASRMRQADKSFEALPRR